MDHNRKYLKPQRIRKRLLLGASLISVGLFVLLVLPIFFNQSIAQSVGETVGGIEKIVSKIEKKLVFSEERYWQVASDATSVPVVKGSTKNSSEGSTASSLALTKPSGVQNQDLLLIIAGNDDSGATSPFDEITGWTRFINEGDGTSDSKLACYWRVADGTETSTTTVTTGSNNDEIWGWYIRIGGADTTAPINATGTVYIIDSDSSHAITEATTDTDNCLVIYALAFDGGEGYPFTVSGTGWTEKDEQQSGSAGTDASGCWGTKELASQGGAGTSTVVSNTEKDGATAIQFAIAPATIPILDQNHYRWRADLDGLNASSSGWLAAEDTAYDTLQKATTTRLRIEIANTSAYVASTGAQYQLEYAEKNGSCGSFTAVPTTTGASPFVMATSSKYADNDSVTSSFLTATDSWTSGKGVEHSSNKTSAFDLATSTYTEFEYAIQATANVTLDQTYCFRLTNNGTTNAFHYTKYPEVTVPVSPWTTLNQRAGILENDGGSTITTPHTAKIGERMQARIQVDTDSTGDYAYRVLKLQYDKDSDDTWVDVSAATEIRPARSTVVKDTYVLGGPEAGTCTTSATWKKGIVYENTAKTDAYKIYSSGCQEIAFVVDTKNASASTTYRLRLFDVTANSTLDNYYAYPSFTTVTTASTTKRYSKSLQTATSTTYSDLKYLLDDLGYSNVNASDSARAILQNVLLDTTEDKTLENPTAAADDFSNSVASGDVNGDGYSDIIVGSPSYSTSRGRVYIFYGGSDMSTTSDKTLNDPAATDYDSFGDAVASGDVNGDGYDDVIVGSYRYSNNGYKGRTYIFYGGSDMSTTSDKTLNNPNDTNGDYFGDAVASGDVNGDGYADVIVGSDGYDVSDDEGRVYIFYGGSDMSTTSDKTLDDPAVAINDYFGNAVASGDVNGDGYDDIIVGSSGYSSYKGRTYIFYGGSDMNTTSDKTLNNPNDTADDDFGDAVASGDVNGDGYADVIVGSSGYSTNRGRTYIFYGGSDMNTTSDKTLDDPAATNSDYFGEEVASGDVNGDGYSDIIVGSPYYDAFPSAKGRTYIFYGGFDMNTTEDKTLNDPNDTNGDEFGYAVASGDVNGDGYPDVIAGSSGYSSDKGRAYVFYSGANRDGTADQTETGASASDQFSRSIAWGDVNGDGDLDAIIGANGYDAGGATGRVYIYYSGHATGTADVIFTGEGTSNSFGLSASSADINGDGYDDIIVGAPQRNTSTGRAYIFYGSASLASTTADNADVILTGETTNNNFGYSVSSAGDIDNDGYDDVIIGAGSYSTETGRAYIYYGTSSWSGSFTATSSGVIITGEGTNNDFGYNVSSAGDVNGDGYDDVIVGAYRYNNNYTGRAYIYYGTSSWSGSFTATSSDVIMTGTAINNQFGFKVSSAGDVNADGYSDAFVGANGADKVYIFSGSSSMSSSTAAADADMILSGGVGTNFGQSIASGDITGNGYDDVIIGASSYSTETGRVYIFYTPFKAGQTSEVLAGEGTYSQFGWTVSIQDINKDGYSDVMVGARRYNNNYTGKFYTYMGGKATSSPFFYFADAVSGSPNQIDASWKGQSTVGAATNNLELEVYRFGTTNAWETASTSSSCATSTDCTLSKSVTADVSEYYSSGWSYWRAYQASGNQALQTNQWSLTTQTSNIDISGTVYTNEGTTTSDAGSIVHLVVDGVSNSTTTASTTDGSYSFSSVSASAGNVLTVFLDDSSEKGVTVTKASSTNMSGINIYKDRVIVRNDHTGSITISDLDKYDYTDDDDILFTASSTPATLTASSTSEFFVWSGDTFKTGDVSGAVSLADVDINGTFTATSTQTISVSGSWDATGGTFTSANSNVKFTSTASGKTIKTNSNSFYDLTFDGSGGGWTLQDAVTTTDNLNVTAGTLTWGNGDADNLSTTGTTTISNGATLQSKQDLAQGSTMTWTASGDILVSGTLDIAENVTINLNSSASVQDGIEVEATGYLEIEGKQATTSTVSSLVENTTSTTITVSDTPWSIDQFNNMHLRISSTSSLAFGKIYDVNDTTASTVNISATTSATDASVDVAGAAACSGNATCVINVDDGLISANNQGIGRYLYNNTNDDWYLIVDSAEDTQDTITIVTNSPDAFTTMDDGDSVKIVDGIRATDEFEILDYAHITAHASNHGYIAASSSSETLIRYADISEMGANTLYKYGVDFEYVDGSNAGEGATIEKSRIYDSYYCIYFNRGINNNAANSAGITNNEVYNCQEGIYLDNWSSTNTVSYNTSYNNVQDGFFLQDYCDGNTLEYNTTYNNINNYGFNLFNYCDNNILNNNTSYNNSDYGFMVYNGSNGNTLTSNHAYSNTNNGFDVLTSSNNNTLTSNHSHSNTNVGFMVQNSSNNNILTSNYSYDNDNYGFQIYNSAKNNILDSNHAYNNTGYGFILYTSAQNNLFISNNSYDNSYGFILHTSASDNIFSSNTVYDNDNVGFYPYLGSHNNIFTSNDVYGNSFSGYNTRNSNGNISINDNYGAGGDNTTADIHFTDTDTASTLRCYSCDLGSPTSTVGVTYTGAHFLSLKHDSVATSTKLWGEYTIPDNDTETPQDEGTNKFNYTNNLWEDSITAHGYSGSGTEDPDIGLAFSGGTMAGATSSVAYMVTSKAATSTWTVYRDAVDIGTATTTDTFTDTANNVQFTIGTSNYVQGDTYTFVAFKNSNNTDTQKTLTMMQDGDTFTVGSGETIELKGQSNLANRTKVSADTGNYSFDINGGTIDAQYYDFDGTDDEGLRIYSSATITELAGGNFDNIKNSAGNSSYLRIQNVTVTDTYTSMVFDDNSDGADGSVDYSVWADGASIDIDFTNYSGNKTGEASDNDLNSASTTWVAISNIDISGTVYTNEGTTTSDAGSIVHLVVDGVSNSTTTASTTDGSYSFSSVSASAGNVLTVFLDDSSEKGVTVTKASSTNMSGINIYKDRVIVRNDHTGSITISDLDKYDYTDDDDILFTASSTPATLTASSTSEFFVWSGDTFKTGDVSGAVSLADVDINGTFTATSTQTISVSGSWDATGGTFTSANSNVKFTSTASGKTIKTNSNSFYDLTFDGSGGGWTLQDAVTTTDNLNVTAGTLTWGNGDADNLSTTGTTTISNGATLQSKQDLAQGSTMTWTASGDILVSGTLDIAENVTINLNSSASVQDGIEVEATGYLEIEGKQATTSTVSSLVENTTSTTITVSDTPWSIDQFNNMHLRISSTSSLAFGKIYDVNDTTASTVNISATTSATDASVDVAGAAACSGNATCVINVDDGLISANNQGIGRYLYNNTNDDWYLIVDSAEDTQDTITIVTNSPDAFTTMDDGDSVKIVDGIRATDEFEILDYAHITAHASNHGYIYAKDGSETLIRYGDISEMGADTATQVGIYFYSIDGSNANEGATIDKSRIYNGYRPIYLDVNSSNNNTTYSKGISNNASYSNNKGILLEDNSSNNTVSFNTTYSHTWEGIQCASASDNNTFSYNVSYNNHRGVSIYQSDGNTISNNKIYNNSDKGIFVESYSDDNILSSNTCYANNKGIQVYDHSKNNILSSNTCCNGDKGIQLESYSDNNILSSNTCYSNTWEGIQLWGHNSNNILFGNISHDNNGRGISFGDNSSNNIVLSNDSYDNSMAGIYTESNSVDLILGLNDSYSNAEGLGIHESPGIIAILENYGASGANSNADIKIDDTNVGSTIRCYSCDLDSSTEYSETAATTSTHLISLKHDSVATSTKLWGEYTIPNNDTETPQDEGTNKFNYAGNLWEDSITAHGYSGTGSEDPDIGLAFSGGTMAGATSSVAYMVTSKAATSTWTVYRDAVDIGTATTTDTFTDTANNVQFTIGTSNYVQGDSYTFVAFKNSNNTDTQKTLTMMQDGDIFTVGSGETIELKGQSEGSNLTEVTRGGSGGYSFNISGTIDAQYYTFDYLGGSGTDAENGLYLQTGATMTSLDNGAFDNFISTGGVWDSFLTIHTNLIGTATSTNISEVSFENTGSTADYNVKATSTAVSGYWTFMNWDGSFGGEADDSDVTVSPGEIRWSSGDYLSFTISDNQIFFGLLNSGSPRFASSTAQGDSSEIVAHTLTASTTASDGYTITVRGATLTSGGLDIDAMSPAASSTQGSEQFGIRLTASGGSGQVSSPYDLPTSYAYEATAASTDVIASAGGISEDTTYSVYYVSNIETLTKAGDYTTTITYVITANF